ncbi:hypothetical protein A2841_00395 [Candidatus Kaiserbacteria bacterium RIFCSPHIGHO2_01_FULL_48_10]|uniref:Uncharacterized protein n=1 Tax=Candidatus Kaiserbacteria bacterium RIFCSPHIGHO2_01_FULL_48_10 TaxID=1798476 RepID=A0A1F6C4U4_9BACT|nr:MAG: hypothetical protein A2841_00395 [Candidatus Kaiserbacteria bacterium RIFCSPHIGHO2_01_FULL_48_10]
MNSLKKISWKAIIIGAVIDVVGTNVASIFFFSYIITQYSLSSLPSEQYVAKIQEIILHNPVLFGISFLIGAGFSVLGGYVAAWIAKRNELLNGALSSFLCVLSGLAGLFMALNPSVPIILEILSIPLSPALGFLGGYIRKRQISSAPVEG